MNIYAVITNNNVAAPQTICYNTIPAGLTGTAPGGGTVSTLTSGRVQQIMSLSTTSEVQQAPAMLRLHLPQQHGTGE